MSHKNFDPNSAASKKSGIYGLPYEYLDSKVIYMPIPWEATTSYGGGTSNGPKAIFEASKQVDLYDFHNQRFYEKGLFYLKESSQIKKWNLIAKKEAQKIIKVGGEIGKNKALKSSLKKVNELSGKVNQLVEAQVTKILKDGKIPALIGGDHSVPLGAFHAVAKQHGDFGVLHFDAHSDTREAYEGFQYSHASIFYNALTEVQQIKKLVQVGIRDFCEQEVDFCKGQGDRVSIFFDADLAQRTHQGDSWLKISEKIVSELPQKVWISFDIDGLDPRFCPHTGTPVPGGLDFNQAVSLLKTLADSGRKIIGFDLNEVAPGDDEWDANVGARLLYKMTGFTLKTYG